jgi:hypothetical protein
MNCLSLSHRADSYRSTAWRSSETHSRVRFAILKMSFGRRLEIAREIREIGQRLEFLEAGGSLAERAEASAAGAEIDRVYLRCGLAGIEGIEIDGLTATAESLFGAGPEDLTREILDSIKAEWGLSEPERKNC